MVMLAERYRECVDTLSAERHAFEATFRHVEADGSTWMFLLAPDHILDAMTRWGATGTPEGGLSTTE